jgi:hypothetical protein
VDQPHDLPSGDNAMVHVAGVQPFAATRAFDQRGDGFKGFAAGFCLNDGLRDGVFRHAGGVAKTAKDKLGRPLISLDQHALDVRVDRRLDRGAETRAHVDALGPQRKGRHQPAPIAKSAAGQQGHTHLVRRRRDQDQAGNIILARMPCAFKAVDADDVGPHPFGGQRVAHGGAFVQNGDAVALEVLDMLTRVVAGGFNDLDPALDNRAAIIGIGWRVERGQQRQVHPERPVGQAATPLDLGPQRIGRGTGQRGDDPQPARVRHSAGHIGRAHPHHAALNDGVLDA